MANGYERIAGDELAEFSANLRNLADRVAELERPTGSQTASALKKLQDLVNGLLNQVNVVATGYVQAGTDVTGGGTGNFAAGLRSVGAYNTDVSALAGARQTVWQHNSGVYGFAPSSMAKKANLGPVPFTSADVLAVQPYVFQYRAQLELAVEDPDYVVPWEIGLMAEHLIEHNMGCFVFWEEDGETPRGINYDLFGAITPLILASDFDARLRALESLI